MNYYLLSCLKLKNYLSALFLSDHHQHIPTVLHCRSKFLPQHHHHFQRVRNQVKHQRHLPQLPLLTTSHCSMDEVLQLLSVGGKEAALYQNRSGQNALHVVCEYFTCDHVLLIEKLIDLSGRKIIIQKIRSVCVTPHWAGPRIMNSLNLTCVWPVTLWIPGLKLQPWAGLTCLQRRFHGRLSGHFSVTASTEVDR